MDLWGLQRIYSHFLNTSTILGFGFSIIGISASYTENKQKKVDFFSFKCAHSQIFLLGDTVNLKLLQFYFGIFSRVHREMQKGLCRISRILKLFAKVSWQQLQTILLLSLKMILQKHSSWSRLSVQSFSLHNRATEEISRSLNPSI